MRRIIIEANLCDGCKNCSVACMQAHRKDVGTIYDLDMTDLANESRNHIIMDGHESYKPIFCRHCEQPECVMSCMSGALYKEQETGLVLYREEKCGSCFMCVMNCPYGTLKPDTLERRKIIKCDFCKDAGGNPSCVASCPKHAIHVEEV